MDPRDLNLAIKREHYQLPTAEEIVARLNGAKYFTTLDASQAFYQIQLDEESSKLCTISTPFGRFRFLRLPYGIKSASEVFQRSVSQMLEDLEGAISFIDDILIWGNTKEQHDERLYAVLTKLRQENLKLNKAKCQFCVPGVKYLGHWIENGEIKPDEDKVRAINDMPPPADKKALQRFLGLVNYVGKFIPNLSQETAVLRQLLIEKNEFSWSFEHVEAYSKIKQIITNDPVLKIYDPNKTVTVSVDSNQKGMGAVLEQEGHPVEYASKTLTPAQCHYAQIEKELLAIVFGLERFHQYVYAREVIVNTDHKPLEAIVRKPLAMAPPRIQRLLLRLQKYPNARIVYIPGKDQTVADALSRAYLNETFNDDNLDAQVHGVISTFTHVR